MAVIKQGGRYSVPDGHVMGTRGPLKGRAQVCQKCGSRADGNMTINANGQIVCSKCMSPKDRVVITGCDSDDCACKLTTADEPDPA